MEQKSFLTPVQRFINAESLAGTLLIFATILALIVANSPLAGLYNSLWKFKIGISSESFQLVKPIGLWINDGLMALFFFLIGLEIKRELLIGELNSLTKASLPVFAAIGGMVVPPLLFLIFNSNPEATAGWGITMATDIAFTLAILQVLGKRVPIGLKIFLTAFAIIDDIGAVLVIALFYTSGIAWNLLAIAGVLLLILYILSWQRIHSKFIIVIFGAAIWILFLKAGIHPTLAGILLAFAVPIRQRSDEFTFAERLEDIVERITAKDNTNPLPVLTHSQIEAIDDLEEWTDCVQSPLQQLEHRLHGWVAYFVLPLFAFANAGVTFGGNSEIDGTLALVTGFSLVAGKTIGVFLLSLIGIRLKLASLPQGVTTGNIFGVALISGVGFTMSIFISNLAFADSFVLSDSARIGIMAGSLIAGIAGLLVTAATTKSRK